MLAITNAYFLYLGSRFWKTSKRIRAVKKSEVKVKKGRVKGLDSSSDSDFDFAPQHRAKKMSAPLASSSSGTMDKTIFECLVCKSQTSFPAVVSPCCNVILGCEVCGCEVCVAQWLEAQSTCPHCRASLTLQDCPRTRLLRCRALTNDIGELVFLLCFLQFHAYSYSYSRYYYVVRVFKIPGNANSH